MLTTNWNKKFKPLLCWQCFAWGIKASVAVFALLCMEDKIDWKITFWHLLRTCGKWLAVLWQLKEIYGNSWQFFNCKQLESDWKGIGKRLESNWKALRVSNGWQIGIWATAQHRIWCPARQEALRVDPGWHIGRWTGNKKGSWVTA